MRKKAGKRVGILGGFFDPVHNGHIGLAAQVRKKFQLDQILFIPAYISPHKQDRGPASPHHRPVGDFEISFTVDTLSVLIHKQPDTEFFLIMGNDAFAGIKTWKSVHRVLEMCHVIVATRPGFTLEGIEESLKNLYPDVDNLFSPPIKEEGVTVFHHREKATTLNFFDLVPMDISSNVIRERINKHRQIKNMLPLEVENYIIKNQLYRAMSHP